MEVAAGEDVPVVRENQRVVGDGIDLRLNHLADIVVGHAAGPVDLGQAAQGVGILHPGLALVDRQPAALQDLPEVGCHVYLSLVGANGLNTGVVGIDNALQGVNGERGGNVGGLDHHLRVVDGQAGHAHHGAGAVDQSQALLGLQLHHRDAGGLHSLSAGHDLALVDGLTLADHGHHHVGQGAQVAAGTHRALFGNYRMYALVQHLNHRLHGGQPDTGEALGQGVDPQKHNRPGHILREGVAHAAGIGHDQVVLQLVQVLLRDGHVDKLAKAGAEPVDHFVLRHIFIYNVPGYLDGFLGLLRQGGLRAVPRNLYNLLHCQTVAVQVN